jgi:hypothetical protein
MAGCDPDGAGDLGAEFILKITLTDAPAVAMRLAA